MPGDAVEPMHLATRSNDPEPDATLGRSRLRQMRRVVDFINRRLSEVMRPRDAK